MNDGRSHCYRRMGAVRRRKTRTPLRNPPTRRPPSFHLRNSTNTWCSYGIAQIFLQIALPTIGKSIHRTADPHYWIRSIRTQMNPWLRGAFSCLTKSKEEARCLCLPWGGRVKESSRRVYRVGPNGSHCTDGGPRARGQRASNGEMSMCFCFGGQCFKRTFAKVFPLLIWQYQIKSKVLH